MGSPVIFNGDYAKLLKQALRLGARASAPSSPAAGDVYYDSSLTALRYHDGTGFSTLATDVADGPSLASNYTISASVAANALTIALKTKAGTDPSSSDPVKVAFRSATASNGGYEVLSIESALSIVVSSGSTLGHASAYIHPIWVYLFNDGGAPRLGVSTTLSDPDKIASSTAEGGAGGADSNSVIYTGTAVTSKAFRILAKLTSNQTTAGTWAAAPTVVSLNPVLVDLIEASYRNTSGQTVTDNTATAVTYNSKLLDTHNAYNTSTGVYTCPANGYYLISATQLTNSVTWTAVTHFILMEAYRNSNLIYRNIWYAEANHTNNEQGQLHCIVDCSRGDTLEVRITVNRGASTTLFSSSATNNHLHIFRLAGFAP